MMKTNDSLDLLLGAGELLRPLLIVVLLVFLWIGLGHTGLRMRNRLYCWLFVGIILAVWLFSVTWLGLAGTFEPNTSVLLPKIPFAIFLPLAVVLCFFRSQILRLILDASSPGWLIGIQVYRVFGVIFIVHWHLGNVPGVFALPAGIGDILVGILAIPVAFYVGFRKSGWIQLAILWNWLGVADLVSAVTLGFISTPGQFQAIAFENPNQLIGTYPLVMVPAFAVPLSFALHALSLWQLYRKKQHLN